jgi:cell division protein ZapA (FtsZ GTPase activity inhibitor)
VKREIAVVVAGHTLHLRTDEDEAYVKTLGSFVEEKIREIARGQAGITTLNLALTAAMSLADEVQKLRTAQAGTDAQVSEITAEIDHILDARRENTR